MTCALLLCVESVLEDTAIGQVGVARWRSREHGGGGGGTLDVLGEEEEEVEEEGEGEARAGREVREKMIPEQREALRVKQESLEKTAGEGLASWLPGCRLTASWLCVCLCALSVQLARA